MKADRKVKSLVKKAIDAGIAGFGSEVNAVRAVLQEVLAVCPWDRMLLHLSNEAMREFFQETELAKKMLWQKRAKVLHDGLDLKP